MDKWVVNNYIVQMRHSVSQARVHVLSKLVRDIRKLQNKKGTDEQKEKNSRKAERLRQEVIFMKNLDPDELSKYALLSTADPSEMLNKVSLTIEERSKLRLVAHKSIIQQVEIFRAKYPEWALKLPPLLVQLGLQIKYKKKAKSQESNSVTSVTNNNRNLKVNSETGNMMVVESIGSVPGISKVIRDNEILQQKSTTKNKTVGEENANPRVKRSSEKPRKKGEKERKRTESLNETIESESEEESIENESEDETTENESEDNSNHSPSANLTIPKKFQLANSEIRVLSNKFDGKKKINGIAEVRRFADLLESDGNCENELPAEEDEEPNPTNSVTDPFFLTGDGSGESGDEMNSSEEEDEEEEDKRKSSFKRRDQFFLNSRDKKPGNRFIREKRGSLNFEKKITTGQRYSRGDQKVPTMNRKQRRMMERARFDMKKGSTFSQTSSLFPKHFEGAGKKQSFPSQSQTNIGMTAQKLEKLHPSWEAKRKQKELILPFQGKKIKFEDDGD